MEAEIRAEVATAAQTIGPGPFGNTPRFHLLAATGADASALRGLGTYGKIKDAPAYLVGVLKPAPMALVDYGYLFEMLILHATDLGLGTCWLGGTFTRSRFARAVDLRRGEEMPAAVSIGRPGEKEQIRSNRRARFGPTRRLPADQLFFDESLAKPLAPEDAGGCSAALTAVRQAPSASNKQPWRIVRSGSDFHFFLERSKGYGTGPLLFTLLRLSDLQLLDIGIAICHFDLVAREAGLLGEWVAAAPGIDTGDRQIEYVATWRQGERDG